MHIQLPASIDGSRREVVTALIADLALVAGVRAVVVGGSHARGTAVPSSDVDLGLYYVDAAPFAIEQIRYIANRWSAPHSTVVTNFYEWGPWVNGGAWLRTTSGRVDLLFRSIDDVKRTLAEAVAGTCHRHYDQQPAHGFYSVIYLAEIADCWIVTDPHSAISRLRHRAGAVRLKGHRAFGTSGKPGAAAFGVGYFDAPAVGGDCRARRRFLRA